METDLMTAVQACLAPGDKCVHIIEAGLVQDWVKMSRVLALIEHSGEHGFLIFLSTKSKVAGPEDLIIETSLSVNSEFRCEIDMSGIDLLTGVDVYLKVSSQKKKLLFEVPFTAKIKAFMIDVTKAVDSYLLRIEPFPNFAWMQVYATQSPDSGLFSAIAVVPKEDKAPVQELKETQGFEDDFADVIHSKGLLDSNCSDLTKPDMDSPDGFANLPRHSIAVGATPLAARESVVRLQMVMREEDYTNIQTLRIFTGTWNVNGKSPTISLGEWLSSDPEPPDVYAVGFQELDLSTEVYIFSDTPRENEWLSAVINGLHPKASYLKVKLIRLVGMMLLVFIRVEHYPYVQNIGAETVGTGLMGKMGNKGGVAVRFDLHNTSICIVNCHLAAHVEEYERRNQDYNDICSRMIFNQFKPPKMIKDHDQVYWIGDMNYRITSLDLDTVKAYIDKQLYNSLLEYDQLNIQHSLKKIFIGFTEGTVNFVPTYKYDPGTNTWDSSEKCRTPAWCDRVLYKGEHIHQLSYRCHPSLLISDHKPVSAVFESGIKVVDEVRYRKIYEEVMKKLDKLENEFLPQVTVDKMEIRFDDVHFIEPQVRYLTIANTGQVPVQFEFIKKPNDSRYCKDWLRIKPFVSFIMPGEKCDIELEVYVDKRTAWKLNSGKDRIYDILVLHLEGGKDLFITVQGNYIPSCFGSSLQGLLQMKGPIRDIPLTDLVKLETACQNEEVKPFYEIPKEVWILVDHLFKYGLTQEDLFQQHGLGAEIQRIRDRLDIGWPEHVPGSIHSVAEAFLLFLEALAEPVIPYKFHDKCLECSNNFSLSKQVIAQIPEVNQKTFHYLIFFLREIRQHASHNKLDPKMLATLFGSILLRSAPQAKPPANSTLIERKRAAFIYHFLMNDYHE